MGGGTLLGLLPELADAKPSKKQDVAILNYALTLEYLENEFYKEGLRTAGLPATWLSAARIVQGHEATHVAALKKALGRKAVKKPSFDFGATTSNSADFLKTAVVLEDTGVSAYAGQGPRIKQKAVVVSGAGHPLRGGAACRVPARAQRPELRAPGFRQARRR